MNLDYIPHREEELAITPWDIQGQHLVTIEKYNKRILINEAILNLLNLIDGKKSIKSILTDYNNKYESDMTFDDFLTLHDDKLAETGIIKSEREIDVSNKTSYLALRYQFLSSENVGKVASKILPLFEYKNFITIFGLSLLRRSPMIRIDI